MHIDETIAQISSQSRLNDSFRSFIEGFCTTEKATITCTVYSRITSASHLQIIVCFQLKLPFAISTYHEAISTSGPSAPQSMLYVCKGSKWS